MTERRATLSFFCAAVPVGTVMNLTCTRHTPCARPAPSLYTFTHCDNIHMSVVNLLSRSVQHERAGAEDGVGELGLLPHGHVGGGRHGQHDLDEEGASRSSLVCRRRKTFTETCVHRVSLLMSVTKLN